MLFLLNIPHSSMDNSYLAIEKRVEAACKAARQKKRAKIAPLAREFGVPVSRLRARLQGRPSRSSRPITTKRLDASQEAALVRWIERLDTLHVPPTAGMVEASANAIIRVVGQRYELYYPLLEGKTRLYIQHGAKLIGNQLGCLYRHLGANSDGAACFLICTSLISQQFGAVLKPMVRLLERCGFTILSNAFQMAFFG